MNFKLSKYSKWEIYLIIIAILVGVGAIIFNFNVIGMFNSDVATANLLAYEQKEAGQFFPSTWYYGQDIWTFTINCLMVPISYIINNQVVIREIASLIFGICTVVIIVFYHKKILNDKSSIISFILIFNFTGLNYLEPGIVHGYIHMLAYMLLGLMFFCQAIDKNFKVVDKKYLIILALLIIYLSMGGTRYFALFTVPLLVAIVLVYLLENYKKSWIEVSKDINNLLINIVVIIIAGIIGIMLFVYLKNKVNFSAGISSPIYTDLFYGIDKSQSNILNNIGIIFSNVLALIGIKEGVNLFGFLGVLNVIKVFVGVCCVIVFPVLLCKQYFKQGFKVKILIIFSIVHIGINIFMGIFMNMLTDRYLLTSLYLTYIMSAYYIYNYMLDKEFLIKLSVIIGIAFFTIPNLYGLVDIRKTTENVIAQEEEFLDLLKSNDLKYGYASYWNAGKHTVLSDFDIQINGIIIEEENLLPYYWLSSKDWYESRNYTGKTFLLLTSEEKQTFEESRMQLLLGKPIEVLYYKDLTVVVYSYNIAEKAWESENILFDQSFNDKVEILEDASVRVNSGGVIYGPYINLQSGNYEVKIDAKNDQQNSNVYVRITAFNGKEILNEGILSNGENSITFTLDTDKEGIEIVIENTGKESLYIECIELVD